MALTYELIATTTSGGANIEFTSIPATYTDLILVQTHRNDSQATDTDGFFRFNDDTGNNNTYQGMLTGVADYTTPWSAIMWFADPFSGNEASGITLQISNYANTNIKKSYVTHIGSTDGNAHQTQIGYWNSTSAITSIKSFSADRWRMVGATPDNFNSGSIFSLYGIKEA